MQQHLEAAGPWCVQGVGVKSSPCSRSPRPLHLEELLTPCGNFPTQHLVPRVTWSCVQEQDPSAIYLSSQRALFGSRRCSDLPGRSCSSNRPRTRFAGRLRWLICTFGGTTPEQTPQSFGASFTRPVPLQVPLPHTELTQERSCG